MSEFRNKKPLLFVLYDKKDCDVHTTLSVLTPFPILVLFIQYENRQYTAGNIYKAFPPF